MENKTRVIVILVALLMISIGFIAIQQIEKQNIEKYNEGYVSGFRNATIINYNQILSSLVTNGYVDVSIENGNRTQVLRLIPQGV